MKHITRFAAAAICILFLSCGEDPELVKKHGEQEAQIAKLKGELALTEELLKNLPPDQSSELEMAKRETRKLEAEHKKLSEEVAELEGEHKALQEKYEAYQRKYAVR